jgi:hypothetical protein
MAMSTDPVGDGLVASLARPGGNVTGLATSADDTRDGGDVVTDLQKEARGRP